MAKNIGFIKAAYRLKLNHRSKASNNLYFWVKRQTWKS